MYNMELRIQVESALANIRNNILVHRVAMITIEELEWLLTLLNKDETLNLSHRFNSVMEAYNTTMESLHDSLKNEIIEKIKTTSSLEAIESLEWVLTKLK